MAPTAGHTSTTSGASHYLFSANIKRINSENTIGQNWPHTYIEIQCLTCIYKTRLQCGKDFSHGLDALLLSWYHCAVGWGLWCNPQLSSKSYCRDMARYQGVNIARVKTDPDYWVVIFATDICITFMLFGPDPKIIDKTKDQSLSPFCQEMLQFT